MKKISVYLLAFTLLVLGACAPTEIAPNTTPDTTPDTAPAAPLEIAVMTGPTGMGMAQLMSEGDPDNYNFTVTGTPDDIVAKLSQGTLDLATVPANLAAVLYAKTEGQMQVLATNTSSVLYLLEQGDSIQSLADLAGQTIYSTGKGSTPEFVFSHLLQNAGLLDQVTIEYKSEAAEIAAALAAGQAKIALLPQPFVTAAMAKNPDLRIALSLGDLWKEAVGTDMVTGVLVGRKDVITAQKDRIDAFLADYKKSIDFAVENPEKAAAYIGTQGIAEEKIALKALPFCGLNYSDGETMQTAVSAYLTALHGQNPKAVGGTLPDEAFYYKK